MDDDLMYAIHTTKTSHHFRW